MDIDILFDFWKRQMMPKKICDVHFIQVVKGINE